MPTAADSPSTRPSSLFSWRQVMIYAAVFAGVTLVLQRGLRKVCDNVIEFDCPYYWPISVFNPGLPSLRDLAVALGVAVLFILCILLLERVRYKLKWVVLSAILLITGLTYVHGVDVGFYAPVAGDAQTGVLDPNSLNGQEYYHDALAVTDPVDFLRRFNKLQPTLHRHSHTHPPGAVLTFYFLNRALGDPALIALAIMMISMGGTIFFVYRVLTACVEVETASFVTLLFALLPAVQIYYLASLDALVAALLTGAIYFFCFSRARGGAAAAAALASMAFLLTFVSLFIFPVLVGFELVVRRRVTRSVVLVGGVAGFHLLLYLLAGYNPVESFRTASAFENSQGFMLATQPANYFFTRLEDIAEIIVFLGPFLLVLFVRGLKGVRERPLNVLALLACGTVFGMFLTGAWRTGETARACLFLYSYLLFPVAYFLEERGLVRSERVQLASLVFAQALAMQTFGNYYW